MLKIVKKWKYFYGHCRECVQMQSWQQGCSATVVPPSAASSLWHQGEATACKSHVIWVIVLNKCFLFEYSGSEENLPLLEKVVYLLASVAYCKYQIVRVSDILPESSAVYVSINSCYCHCFTDAVSRISSTCNGNETFLAPCYKYSFHDNIYKILLSTFLLL